MQNKTNKTVFKHTIFGILFGLTFPISALVIDLFFIKQFSLSIENIILTFQGDILHSIISLAPFVLGIVFYFLGKEKDKLLIINENLDKLVEIQTKELKANQNRFKYLSEVTLEGVVITNKGVIVECNAALCNISGYSFDELIGNSAAMLLTPESAQIMMKNIISNYTLPYELDAINKSGEHVPVEIIGRTLVYNNEEMRVASVRDISFRKKAESIIKENAEQLQQLTANVPGILFRMTIDSNKQSEFIYVSQKSYEILNISSENILSDSNKLFNLYKNNSITAFDSLLESINSNSKIWEYEGKVELQNNKDSNWHRINANIEQNQDMTFLIFGFITDISDEKENQIKKENINNSLLELSKIDSLYNGDIETAFEKIAETAKNILHLDRSSIWFFNENKTELIPKYISGKRNLKSDCRSIDIQNFPNYINQILQNRIVNISDFENDPLTQEFSKDEPFYMGIKSLFDVSIWKNGETIGMFCSADSLKNRIWSADEIHFLTSLCDLIVLSINSNERLIAELKLIESENTLEQAQKIAKMGSWIYDLNSYDLFCSPSFYDLLNIESNKEASFEMILDLIINEDKKILIDVLNNIIKESKDYEIEYRVKNNDNEIIYIYTKINIVKNESNLPIKLIGVSQDITERVLYEKAIKESEAFNKKLLQEMPYPIFVNVGNKIIFANNAMSTLLEYELEEIIASNMLDYVFDDDKQLVLSNVKKRLSGEKVDDYEIRIETKSKNLRNVIISANTIIFENQTSTLAVLSDITDKKLIELQNQQNHEIEQEINYFSTSLLLKNTINELLWDIASNCITRLEFQTCDIYLYDEFSDLLVRYASLGKRGNEEFEIDIPNMIKLGAGIVGSVALSQVPEIISDTSNEPRYVIDDIQRKSELAVPLVSDGKIIGVIDSEHSELNFFNDVHLKVLITIASVAANRIYKIQSQDIKDQLTKELIEQLTENEKLTHKVKLELEEKVKLRTEEIENQKNQILKQNKDISDSIDYAQKIQIAMMADMQLIKQSLPESFVFLKPRDKVSGDFYYYAEKNNKVLIAAIDCTGHGVPGALMSMMANGLLNEIVNQKGILEPGNVLKRMHFGIKKSLRQELTDNQDGMDMSVALYDKTLNLLHYSGAKNPMYIIQNGEIQEIPANKISIGGKNRSEIFDFKSHTIEIKDKLIFYLFSDGYQDQFGGENHKKFMKKNFRNLLLDIHQEDANTQKEMLRENFISWMGNESQIDDVLVIGVKLNKS